MNYEDVIAQFEHFEEGEKTREIYAQFGLAIYFSQLLEQQAINMIVVLKQSKGLKNIDEVNSLWDNYDLGNRSLGVLINEIKQLYNLTEDEHQELKEVLKLRNFIAHDYFRLNNNLFYTEVGQKRMIKDFIEFRNRASEIDRKLLSYFKVYATKLGLTDERLSELVSEYKSKWSEEEISNDHITFKK